MALATINFRSKHLYRNTNVNIILPESPMDGNSREFYESGKKYKVLWLLHGGDGDFSDWSRKSMIEIYAENKDLAIVMPDGYNSFYANWPEIKMDMETYFFEELMPMMYNWFPLSPKREDNYIAGLSMGGLGAAAFAANRPECFNGAAALSVAPVNFHSEPTGPLDTRIQYQYQLANGGKENAINSGDNAWDLVVKNRDRLPKMYFSCGTADDHYEQVYVKFKKYAQENGLPFTFSETEGYNHEWTFWNMEIKKVLDFFGL